MIVVDGAIPLKSNICAFLPKQYHTGLSLQFVRNWLSLRFPIYCHHSRPPCAFLALLRGIVCCITSSFVSLDFGVDFAPRNGCNGAEIMLTHLRD